MAGLPVKQSNRGSDLSSFYQMEQNRGLSSYDLEAPSSVTLTQVSRHMAELVPAPPLKVTEFKRAPASFADTNCVPMTLTSVERIPTSNIERTSYENCPLTLTSVSQRLLTPTSQSYVTLTSIPQGVTMNSLACGPPGPTSISQSPVTLTPVDGQFSFSSTENSSITLMSIDGTRYISVGGDKGKPRYIPGKHFLNILDVITLVSWLLRSRLEFDLLLIYRVYF